MKMERALATGLVEWFPERAEKEVTAFEANMVRWAKMKTDGV